ncbi:MAG: carboxypeptidase-like regulatory domain-containing protein [Ilumatobacter sp.]
MAILTAVPAGAADGGISGTVTGAGGAGPLANVRVCANSVGNAGFGCDTTGADGVYVIGSLPPQSDYRVRFFDLDNVYAPEYYDDSFTQGGAQLVAVSDGVTTVDIDAELGLAGTISGTVTDASGPIEDITVCASSDSTSGFSCASTADDGTYTVLSLVPAADYIVSFDDPAGVYNDQFYDSTAAFADATPVSVATGVDTSGIDAVLIGAGSISGTVTTAQGPRAGVSVCAGREGETLVCATTSSAGTYEIPTLPIGVEFTVSFETDGFVTQFWENANSFGSATPVTILSGGPTSGIDAVLAAGGSVSGTVTDATGAPFPGVFACATSTNADINQCERTGPDGSYEVTNLAAADDYLVTFSVLGNTTIFEYWEDQVTADAADLVAVAAGAETTGIDASLQPIRDFHLLDQACRVLATGPLSGGDSIDFSVAGTIPAVQNAATANCPIPADADAVFANVIVNDPSAAGNLRLAAAGTTPTGGIVNFSANGLDNSNAQNIPLSQDQKLALSVNGGPSGVGQILAAGAEVEILGWWGPNSNPGLGYQPTTPCTFFDSRENQGAASVFLGPFGSSTSLSPVITGSFSQDQGGEDSGNGITNCDVPTSADAVLVNIVLLNSTGDVSVVSPTSQARVVNNIKHTPLMNNASAVVLPVNDDGTVDLDVVVASGATNVRGVVLGYYSDSLAITYVPLTPCATFDTRSNQGAEDDFAGARLGGQETVYDVTGDFDPDQGGGNSDCGVPEGAVAIELNLVAINPLRPGNLRAFASGSTPSGGVLNFANLANPMNNSNGIVLPVAPSGEIVVGVNGGPTGSGLSVTEIRGVVTGYYVVA